MTRTALWQDRIRSIKHAFRSNGSKQTNRGGSFAHEGEIANAHVRFCVSGLSLSHALAHIPHSAIGVVVTRGPQKVNDGSCPGRSPGKVRIPSMSTLSKHTQSIPTYMSTHACNANFAFVFPFAVMSSDRKRRARRRTRHNVSGGRW